MPKLNDVASAGRVNPNEIFRDRLMKRFAAHEWVRVINPDDERFTWQYLPSHKEEHEFTPDPMKITRRGAPEVYYLDPGDSEVLVGENAYIMIEGLYKKLVAKKKILDEGEAKPGVARNFNWTDANLQEQWIDKIYLGKEEPTFSTTPKETKQPEPGTGASYEPKTASPARKAV